VNDENTLRQAGGRNDPYSVFGNRLRKGSPPDDWDALIKEAETLHGATGEDVTRTVAAGSG